MQKSGKVRTGRKIQMTGKRNNYSDEQIITSFLQNMHFDPVYNQYRGPLLEGIHDYKSLIHAYKKKLLTRQQVQFILLVMYPSLMEDDEFVKLFYIKDFDIFNDMDDEAIELYFRLNL